LIVNQPETTASATEPSPVSSGGPNPVNEEADGDQSSVDDSEGPHKRSADKDEAQCEKNRRTIDDNTFTRTDEDKDDDNQSSVVESQGQHKRAADQDKDRHENKRHKDDDGVLNRSDDGDYCDVQLVSSVRPPNPLTQQNFGKKIMSSNAPVTVAAKRTRSLSQKANNLANKVAK
jgi:hypothetical protein